VWFLVTIFTSAIRFSSLDASTIDLCLSVFPWADFRTTKWAVKLHVGLNHSGYLPEFVTVTEGKTHDVTVELMLKFPKGSIVAVYKRYHSLHVSRAMQNTVR
jgi:putative transposase